MTAGVTTGDGKEPAGVSSDDESEFANAVIEGGGVGLESDPDGASGIASAVVPAVEAITSELAGTVIVEASVLEDVTDEAGTDDALDLLRLGGISPTTNSQCPD